MPGNAALGGMTLDGDQAIPVYDLPKLHGASPPKVALARSSCCVLRVRVRFVGILVDAVGDIPEPPLSVLRPVQMLSERAADLLDGLITPIAREPGAHVPMLLLASIERLRARVQGRQVPSVVALAS